MLTSQTTENSGRFSEAAFFKSEASSLHHLGSVFSQCFGIFPFPSLCGVFYLLVLFLFSTKHYRFSVTGAGVSGVCGACDWIASWESQWDISPWGPALRFQVLGISYWHPSSTCNIGVNIQHHTHSLRVCHCDAVLYM